MLATHQRILSQPMIFGHQRPQRSIVVGRRAEWKQQADEFAEDHTRTWGSRRGVRSAAYHRRPQNAAGLPVSRRARGKLNQACSGAEHRPGHQPAGRVAETCFPAAKGVGSTCIGSADPPILSPVKGEHHATRI